MRDDDLDDRLLGIVIMACIAPSLWLVAAHIVALQLVQSEASS